MKLAYLALALAVPLAACGGNVVTEPSGSTGTGASGTAGAGAGASGTGASTGTGASGTGASTTTGAGGSSPGSPCPPSQPQGGACAPEGLRCTYGDSVRADCRSVVTCSGGTWTGTTSACAMSTICDQFKTPPAGQVCDQSQVDFCVIGDTLCGCSSCLEGPCMAPPVTWQCSGPPSTPGCPPVVPNDGTPCDAPGTQCSYGYACGGSGATVSCTAGGLWLWDLNQTCPL